jgi:hypothetical protein
MQEPTIRVPVSCPACAAEHLSSLSTAATAAALLSGEHLQLQCRCRARWIATEAEREQVREYLAALDTMAEARSRPTAALAG